MQGSKDKEPVHYRTHVRDSDDSRHNWRKFNRHGQPEDFDRETWLSKGRKPKNKDHRK